MIKLNEKKAMRIIGAIFLCFSLLLIFWLIPQIKQKEVFPNQRTFPLICGYIMAFISIAAIINGFIDPEKPGQKVYVFYLSGLKYIAVILIMMVCCTLLLKYLTYIPATFLTLSAMIWYLGYRKKSVIFAIALLQPIAIYLFFTYILHLRLP